MLARSRFKITRLGMLACVMICGDLVCEPIWGQEVLPTLRKHPHANTAWVGDYSRTTGTVPTRTVPTREVAAPQNADERYETQALQAPSKPTVRDDVVAVSDEQPVANERRAATLRALAEGFRYRPPVAVSVPAVQATIAEPSLPVVYSAPPAEEPISQNLRPREYPPQYTGPAPETPAAVVEDSEPVTVEMLPPVAPEMAPQNSARYAPAEEPAPRRESWQQRMISNPLRRAVDSLSPRRNPLRHQD